MSGPVAIRAAGAEETDEVIGLYDWLFDPPGGPPPDWDPAAAGARLRVAIDGEDSIVLVADAGDGALAGFCTAYIDLLSVRYGLRCWVEDLAVDPGRRSQGIGAALLAAGRDWAREHGATHFELDSGLAREDAHRFYERDGGGSRGISFQWWLGWEQAS